MQVGAAVRDRGGGHFEGEEQGWSHQHCHPGGDGNYSQGAIWVWYEALW